MRRPFMIVFIFMPPLGMVISMEPLKLSPW
jgi:hypothetical protein